MTEEEDRLRACLYRYIEVVEQTYKGRPRGIPPEQVRPDCLYVLDWRPERPRDLNSIRVEQVDAIEPGGWVRLRYGTTPLATFASLVVGGPFPLVEPTDAADTAPQG